MKNTLLEGMQDAGNFTRTENNALTHKTSLSHLVDFFATGGALRNVGEDVIISRFSKAFGEDKLLALKTIFYFRDIRGGQGERRVFRVVMNWLAKNHPKFAEANLEIIPRYGRWDDILHAFDSTELEGAAYRFFADQLLSDGKTLLEGGDNTSLAAKWAPSENASSAKTKAFGTKLRKVLGFTSREYRKCLSGLRKHLNLVETTMCQGDWEDIKFSNLPSRAHFKYRKAFRSKLTAQYQSYLNSVEKGEEKINTSTLYPYDVVSKCRKGDSARELDVMWNNLPDVVGNDDHNGLVVCDVSASMTWVKVGNVEPMDVSVSLAIYMAERNNGPFANHFLTFASDSQLIKVSGSTISEKVRNVMRSPIGGSTNLQSAFNSILSTAVGNNVPAEQMPQTIYIISDMQFNCTTGTNYDNIKKKYAAAGYALPKIVFWNVCGRVGDSPVTIKDENTILASGFSPVIFKHVMNSTAMNPEEMFLEVVCQERYDEVALP